MRDTLKGKYSHLFNFHARIYHQLLQQIDSHFKPNNNSQDQLYPASITISIVQLLQVLPVLKTNIDKYFSYDGELQQLIDSFFKLLTKKLNKTIRKCNRRNNKKSKSKSNSPSNSNNSRKRRHENNDNTSSNKRQKLSSEDAAFGPYERRHSLR